MKKAFKDFAKVFLSNIVLLISGVLAGFLIPRIMGITDYGYYKTFSLYNSYKELITFGISEGMYLWLAGKEQNKELISKLKFITKLFIAFEIFLTIIIVSISLYFYSSNSTYSIIFVLTALFCLGSNIESYYASISQSLKNFKIFSSLVFIKSILTIISVLALYIYHKYGKYEIHFYYYSIITILLCLINDIVYIFYYHHKFNGRSEKIENWNSFLLLIVSLGIPLLLANLCQTLILSIDRQVISIFYPVESSNTFATYSFAYNLLALISALVSAIATVLFPYMKGKDETKLAKAFPIMHASLLIILSFSCCAYFVLKPIVSWILPKYIASLPIFQVLLPGMLISSTISILFHSYYKTYGYEKVYFLLSIIILALSLLADISVYYLFIVIFSPDNPIGIAITSTITSAIWYFSSILFLSKKRKIKHLKTDFYMLVNISGFYLISYLISSWWLGLIYYFLFVFLTTLCFYCNKLKKLFFLLKRSHLNEKRPNN